MIVGIDPGLTGAVAFISFDAPPLVLGVRDTPSFLLNGKRREYDVPGLLRMFTSGIGVTHRIDHVFVEKQGTRPEQGVASVFKIGLGMGLWEGILAAFGIPYTIVPPQVWQREMYQGAVNAEGKERSLLIASRLWPHIEIPKTRHDRADALLIAEYGRRVLSGRVEKGWKEVP